MFSFSLDMLIAQYTLFFIPFVILIGGVLLTRFKIGGFR